MSIKAMQQKIKVRVDGQWGKDSHATYLCSGLQLDFDWDALRNQISGSFTQGQVDGLNFIIAACNRALLKPQHAAYILATAWHETAFKMQPISEYGRGASRRYGQWLTNSKGQRYCYSNGNMDEPTYYTYDEHPHLYYGRGFPQLTWLDNYVRASEELGVDFVNNPELANDPNHSADILVMGSMQGWFTTRKLPDRVEWGTYNEYVSARYVINGSDKASKIARYAQGFLDSLIIA